MGVGSFLQVLKYSIDKRPIRQLKFYLSKIAKWSVLLNKHKAVAFYTI